MRAGTASNTAMRDKGACARRDGSRGSKIAYSVASAAARFQHTWAVAGSNACSWLQDLLQLGQHGLQWFKQGQRARCGQHAARTGQEQRIVESRAQLAQLDADGRLAQVQPRGRPRDVAFN